MSPAEYRALVKVAPKPSKYRNVRTTVGGRAFASKREARRFTELKLLERTGEISALSLQPRFRLDVNGCHVCDYYADFSYRDRAGNLVVEDAKGVRTPAYVQKRKLMAACHGIEVVEV